MNIYIYLVRKKYGDFPVIATWVYMEDTRSFTHKKLQALSTSTAVGQATKGVGGHGAI